MKRARSRDRSVMGCGSWAAGGTITMPRTGVGVGGGAMAGTVGTAAAGGGGGTGPVPGKGVAAAGGGNVGTLAVAVSMAAVVPGSCWGRPGTNCSWSKTGVHVAVAPGGGGVQVAVGVLVAKAGWVGTVLVGAAGAPAPAWVAVGVGCGESGTNVVGVFSGELGSSVGSGIATFSALAGNRTGSSGKLMARAITASTSSTTRSRSLRGPSESYPPPLPDWVSGEWAAGSGAGGGIEVGLGLVARCGSWLTALPMMARPFP